VGFYCLTSVGIGLAKAPCGLGFVLLLNPWMALIPFSLHCFNLIDSYLNMEVDGKYAMWLMVELQHDPRLLCTATICVRFCALCN
jgi:hypothetical protein